VYKKILTIVVAILVLPPVFGQEAKVTTTLTRSVEGFENIIAYPNAMELTTTKPAWVKIEPKYSTKPLYGMINAGNGPRTAHFVVIDKGAHKLYVDLKGNGDLTKSFAFETKGNIYQGKAVFRVSYGSRDVETSSALYTMRIVWSPSRRYAVYYRDSGLVGTIKLDGQRHTVKIAESDNDGLFNKSFDSPKAHRPLFIYIDNVQRDGRGTFGVNDINYMARVSPDGTKLTMEPTAKAVTIADAAKKNGPVSNKAGQIANDFFALSNGEYVRLSDLRGKVVVLDLWATWCGPCQASLPHVQEISEKYKSKGVVVLALCVYDEKEAYDGWLLENKMYTFPFAYDLAGNDRTSSIAAILYGVKGIPTSFVIGKDGMVIAEIVGYMGKDDKRIEESIDKALAPSKQGYRI